MFRSPFRVFDIHGHLPYRLVLGGKRHELVSRYGAERSERMRLTWDFQELAIENQHNETLPLIDRWVQELDKYNIAGLNFFDGTGQRQYGGSDIPSSRPFYRICVPFD